jgi:uroporphyrin-III C-methyltransferase
VPGITAGIAAPAYAGIPITHREYGSSFAIVTGHRKNREADNIKWEAIAKGIDTVAIYMGVTNLTYIQEQLLQHGKNPETPTALIQWGTKTNQKTVISTLREVNVAGQREGIENPCMIVIGDVVNMHHKINWFENKSINETFIAREAF